MKTLCASFLKCYLVADWTFFLQSSEDESKENNPEPVKLENESPENKSSPPNPTEPLTVNCDISHKLDRTNSP